MAEQWCEPVWESPISLHSRDYYISLLADYVIDAYNQIEKKGMDEDRKEALAWDEGSKTFDDHIYVEEGMLPDGSPA